MSKRLNKIPNNAPIITENSLNVTTKATSIFGISNTKSMIK